MKVENLTDFILPIAILILYFVLNGLKKKQKPQQPPSAPPKPVPKTPPRRQAPVRSQLVSSELSKFTDIDPAYAQKQRSGKSRAQNLFKDTTLRKAFLLKEILNRPYK